MGVYVWSPWAQQGQRRGLNRGQEGPKIAPPPRPRSLWTGACRRSRRSGRTARGWCVSRGSCRDDAPHPARARYRARTSPPMTRRSLRSVRSRSSADGPRAAQTASRTPVRTQRPRGTSSTRAHARRASSHDGMATSRTLSACRGHRPGCDTAHVLCSRFEAHYDTSARPRARTSVRTASSGTSATS